MGFHISRKKFPVAFPHYDELKRSTVSHNSLISIQDDQSLNFSKNQNAALKMWRFAINVLSCALLLSLFQCSSATNNDLIVGDRSEGDTLLATKHVQVNWHFFRWITEKLTYATSGQTKITKIEILDQHTNGMGAHPTILSGGPGQTYVTIAFESLLNRNIDFVVNIYGIKNHL